MNSPPKFGPDGLLPCITTYATSGEVLMLGWMNAEALPRTPATRQAHYWSRSRQVLWHKGGTSSLVQRVVELLPSHTCRLVHVSPLWRRAGLSMLNEARSRESMQAPGPADARPGAAGGGIGGAGTIVPRLYESPAPGVPPSRSRPPTTRCPAAPPACRGWPSRRCTGVRDGRGLRHKR